MKFKEIFHDGTNQLRIFINIEESRTLVFYRGKESIAIDLFEDLAKKIGLTQDHRQGIIDVLQKALSAEITPLPARW